MITRRERPSDQVAVRTIHRAAFADGVDDSQSEPIEAGLLDELRVCDGWIPSLSWVAEIDGDIVGHNVATRGYVGSTPCVGLGPIGVTPVRQRSGVGKALMRAIIGAADATGEPLIALLGDPDYYGQFGFTASSELAIEPPEPAWGVHFQVLPLNSWHDAIAGTFRYAAPFENL